MKIILASNSPRRRELLTKLGVDFEATGADIDETPKSSEDSKSYVMRMALEKAQALYNPSMGKSLIISGDTTCILDGDIIGKPGSDKEERWFLERFSGKEHEVMSSYCILYNGKIISHGFNQALIKFKTLSEQDIDNYILTNEWQDKAGGYAIQGKGKVLVESVTGSIYDIIGLPVFHIAATFDQLSINYDTDSIKQFRQLNHLN